MLVTTEIKLKPEIIELIRKNQGLKNQLMFELKISPSTLWRVLNNNGDKINTPTALRTIGEVLDKTTDELLIEA